MNLVPRRTMYDIIEESFEELIDKLSMNSLPHDLLPKITQLIEEQLSSSYSSFVSQSMQSLLILERWVWYRFSHNSEKWIKEPHYLALFDTLTLWNQNLINSFDNIELDNKALLLIPNKIEHVNRIFEKISQTQNDDDPFIGIVSCWFDNISYFLSENPQYETLPVINHMNQYICRQYVLTDQYKSYLTQLQQSDLSPLTFTTKQLFYIKTCSFSLGSYLSTAYQHSDSKVEDILQFISDSYLAVINIHSQTMESWSDELLLCIACLTCLISGCCWSSGEKVTSVKCLFPNEQASYNLVQGLFRIVNYQPFCKNVITEKLTDELLLMDFIIRLLLFILKTQNFLNVFRANEQLPNLLFTIAGRSLCDHLSLCSYAILGEILTDEKLKEFTITENMYTFFFNVLEQGWNHSSKAYKRIPVSDLLRGFASFAKSGAIQQRVAENQKISVFIEMCDKYPIAYDIIWTLSFNPDIQKQLCSNSPFMTKLIQLANECENKQMRRTLHGICWNLNINHELRSSSRDISEVESFDIMISYSHKEKVLCKQIYDELVKANYRVWIDFDQMHGNVMDAMAQAIERSKIIILCMSEQYRKSNYCRAEAQYAFQQQRKIVPLLLQKHYKPDGWLLFLIGQLMYVDFTKYEFNRAMEMLQRELNINDNVPEFNSINIDIKRETPVASYNTKVREPKLLLSPILPEKISDWTESHVQTWLTRYNLVQMSRLLNDCNGTSLLYLDQMIDNGDSKQILNLLQEDSIRKTGQSLSLTELSCFRSLINEQKRVLRTDTSTPAGRVDNKNCCPSGCQIM